MAEQLTIDQKLKSDPFLDGPTEFLAKTCARLIAEVPQWRLIFSDSIEGYDRYDFSQRALPALRIYNLTFRKEHESHYIYGDLLIDVILPPSLRRDELQTVQDTLSAAMMQQFRRPSFFAAVRDAVPGLQELGKTFAVDKTMGQRWQDGILPITQITANFRLDLKEWDSYLEREGRTKDDPFEVTLASLDRIKTTIQGIRDDETVEVTITSDQKV